MKRLRCQLFCKRSGSGCTQLKMKCLERRKAEKTSNNKVFHNNVIYMRAL